MPDALSTLDTTCAAGAQCAEVQGSPVAAQALGVLQKAVTEAHASLSQKQTLAQALLAALKALKLDYEAVRVALGTYESAVTAVAGGDASVINKAGLLSRSQAPVPAQALGPVSAVYAKPWKLQSEALITLAARSWRDGVRDRGELHAAECRGSVDRADLRHRPSPGGEGARARGSIPGSRRLPGERRDPVGLVGRDPRDGEVAPASPPDPGAPSPAACPGRALFILAPLHASSPWSKRA